MTYFVLFPITMYVYNSRPLADALLSTVALEFEPRGREKVLDITTDCSPLTALHWLNLSIHSLAWYSLVQMVQLHRTDQLPHSLAI